jgi:sugar phosphate isomerase/epimerase
VLLSALVTSLPLAFEQAVRCIDGLGFEYVDVVGMVDRPMSHREALAETKLVVSCAAVGRDLPGGVTLDATSAESRRIAVDTVKRQIDDAAGLGATYCYVTSGCDGSRQGLIAFAEACALLGEHARQRMVRLCLEHVPGRALPTAASVLNRLSANLYLLLDIGHCQLSSETPAEIIERVGDRLGYVHLDDNDGKNDLHLPLLAGIMSERDLQSTFTALGRIYYQGPLCLELNAGNEQPELRLREGRELVMRLVEQTRSPEARG